MFQKQQERRTRVELAYKSASIIYICTVCIYEIKYQESEGSNKSKSNSCRTFLHEIIDRVSCAFNLKMGVLVGRRVTIYRYAYFVKL